MKCINSSLETSLLYHNMCSIMWYKIDSKSLLLSENNLQDAIARIILFNNL